MESEFSDFSLTEGHDQTAIGNNDSKEKDEMDTGGDNNLKNSRKTSKGWFISFIHSFIQQFPISSMTLFVPVLDFLSLLT